MTSLDLALTLVGKRVKFNHQRGLPASHLVVRATEDGLVELEGWAGAFAPHLFAVEPIADLIDRSSIGVGLRDIADRGIDAHAADLARELAPRRGRKRRR